MHLHQVRPLQRHSQVQAPRFQPDTPNARMSDIQAQRHGGLPLKNGKQISLNRLYIAGECEEGIIKIEKDAKALVLGINEDK